MRLWAVPAPRPIERRRYVAGVDDMALMLGISALTGGGSALAGMMGNQNRKGGGYDIIYPSQPSYNESRQRLESDWLTQQFNRMQAGQYPAWYQGIAPQIRQQQQLGLNQAYYGDQFTPGILNQTSAYDASRGLGTGAAASKSYGSQMQKYAQQNQMIENYISQLGYNAMQSDAYQIPQLSNALSADTRAWNTPAMTNYVQPQPNAWDSVSSILGNISGAVPWAMAGQNTTSTSSGNPTQSQVSNNELFANSVQGNPYASAYGVNNGTMTGMQYPGLPSSWGDMSMAGYGQPSFASNVGSAFDPGQNYSIAYTGGQRSLQPWVGQAASGISQAMNYMNPYSQIMNYGQNLGKKLINNVLYQ